MRYILPFDRKLGVCFLMLMFLLCACESDSVEPEKEPEPERTILFYLASDCDLDSYIKKDINEILTGMVGVNGRVVIYHDASAGVPVLTKVRQEGEYCVLDTVETYMEENSASAAVLGRVANRVRELFPSDSYGLVLGSHASGWIPRQTQFAMTKSGWLEKRSHSITRYFGQDNNLGTDSDHTAGMDMGSMAAALPGGYEFIMFDACLMANIEVFYAFRHKAKYIIASAAEILMDGFPYHKVMPLLWDGEEQLKLACREFRDYYENGESTVKKPWGMISLVNTAYMDDLAALTKSILYGKKSEVAEMKEAEVWRYPLIDYRTDVFFDFSDYIQKWSSETQYAQFKQLLNKTVYTVSTKEFSGTIISSEQCCGVSTYIPLKKWSTANVSYDKLEWTQYVYGQ